MRIAAGGFTNISRDHLDYHPSMEAYLAAKLRLFERTVGAGGAAVIDVDHEHAEAVVAAAQAARVAAADGRPQAATGIRLVDSAIDGFAQRCTSCMAATTYGCGCRWSASSRSRMRWSPPGSPSPPAAIRRPRSRRWRSSRAPRAGSSWSGERDGAPIFVDYAHKPDALAKALEALRPYVTGRLVVVFGAGGDRDRGKRPMMGAIAAEKADRVIVTDDNPRSERAGRDPRRDPAAAPGAAEIGDRGEAIRTRDRRAARRRRAADRRQGP